MILFDERYRASILAGKKTETRRLERPHVAKGSLHRAHVVRATNRHGRRGDPEHFAVLRILNQPHQQPVGAMSDREIAAEGFNTRPAFYRELRRIYVNLPHCIENQLLWVVRFEVVEMRWVTCPSCETDAYVEASRGEAFTHKCYRGALAKGQRAMEMR